MKTIPHAILALLLVWAGARTAQAQFWGGKGADPTEQLIQLLGSTSAFSATAILAMRDRHGRITVTTESLIAMRDGKMRTEFDFTKVKGADIQDETARTLKQFGLTRTVAIVRPDRSRTYVVFPDWRAYYEEPLPSAGTGGAEEVQMEKVPQGREIVDGRVCNKFLVTVIRGKGEKFQATVWEAPDLQNFPIRSLFPHKDGSVLASFKNLRLELSDESLFEPPAGATRYHNANDLLQGALLRGFQGLQVR